MSVLWDTWSMLIQSYQTIVVQRTAVSVIRRDRLDSHGWISFYKLWIEKRIRHLLFSSNWTYRRWSDYDFVQRLRKCDTGHSKRIFYSLRPVIRTCKVGFCHSVCILECACQSSVGSRSSRSNLYSSFATVVRISIQPRLQSVNTGKPASIV